MRTELKKHLNSLETPSLPEDLKTRCLSTIPLEGAPHKVTFRKRSFLMRPALVAVLLMFAVVAGIAFWNTRPPSGFARSSGSVAFAQVVENVRQVHFFHAKGYVIDPGGSKHYDELWYDTSRGRYSQALPSPSKANREVLPSEPSLYNRTLMLPNGTLYYRESRSSTVFIGSNPNNWKAANEPVLKILTGKATGTTDLSGTAFGQVISSTTGNWKGQEALILVLERQPSPLDATLGRGPVQAHLYVNPTTKLVIALQDFDKAEDGDLKLSLEYEFDYSSPDPELFNPKSIEHGAEVRSINNNKSLYMPWAPKT